MQKPPPEPCERAPIAIAPVVGSGERSLGHLAVSGFIWSAVQSWGGRLLQFALFVILARFLSPAEFGVASAAAMIILIVTLVAEFGFTDAIIQRPGLERSDVNLPFYFSVGISLTLACCIIAASSMLERWLEIPGTQPVIVALSALAPVQTIALFQEMQYKRNMAFQALAFRVLIANILSGFVSISMAMMGWGVWSLVAQTYVVTFVSLIWMWSRPFWTPGIELRPRSFISLARFSIFILAMRVLDFGATRLVEFITIERYGVRAYGLYAASSRLNLTLLDMLQSALSDVSLSVLSKISGERERLAAIYRVSTVIASNLLSPIFLCAGALAFEITETLFGDKWSGIEGISRTLFILGSVQVVQFLSRPYLSARGRSDKVLVISLSKFAITITGLVLIPHEDIYELVTVFIAMQLLSAPISFYMTATEINSSLFRLVRDLLPVAAAGFMADRAVWLARPWLITEGLTESLTRAITLGVIFVVIYGSCILLFGREQILVAMEFVGKRLKGMRAP